MVKNESGRTLTETLAMLAIVGILSVIGIAGFSKMVDKNKANTLIQEAQRRAVIVAGQIDFNGNTPSLAEFEHSKNTSAGIFDSKVYYEADGLTKQFGIKVDEVEKNVCQNILNTIGDTTPIRRLSKEGALTTPITTCDDNKSAYVIIYNNDMQSGTSDTEYCESDDDCQTVCGKCSATTHLCQECEVKPEECTTNEQCEDAGVCAGCLIPEGEPTGTCQYMCQEVEYLESTEATQYIDTRLFASGNYNVLIDFQFETLNNDNWIYGYWTSYWEKAAMIGIFNNQFRMYIGNDNSSSYINLSCDKSRHTAGWFNGRYIYDNMTIDKVPDLTTSSTAKIFLFGRGNRPILGQLAKIYSCKMWSKDNTVLVRDFVPVLAPKKNDIGQEPAMFDKVNNELYYNAGTGTFDYGPKK